MYKDVKSSSFLICSFRSSILFLFEKETFFADSSFASFASVASFSIFCAFKSS